MRRLGSLVGLSLVGALAAVLALTAAPGAASAAAATTYQGTFSGAIVYTGCLTTPQQAVASGTWAVTLHGNSAKGEFDILVNGAPHVAYTFPGMKQAQVPDTTFVVYGKTQAGLLTVTLYPNSQMTYVIAPYSLDGLSCTSVTYSGNSG
jgi:hypothetical protein